MARYFAAPGATGNGLSWATVGDLQNLISTILAAPSPTGDEIWARQGTYNLAGSPLSIVGNTAPLSIYGGFEGWENTLCDRNANISTPPTAAIPNYFPNPSILDGGGAGGNRVIDMQNVNNILIDGFIIQNGDAGGGEGGGIRISYSSIIRFENLVFMGNMASLHGGGVYMTGTRNIMVKNSIFYDNHATNAAVGIGGGGFCTEDCYFVKFVNLLFNVNTGIGAAMFIIDSENVEIVNNTIADNVSTGTSDLYFLNAKEVNIYNSILYPDTLDIAPGPQTTNINVDYCYLLNLPLTPPPIINVNPNTTFIGLGNPFVFHAGGNYHLLNTAAPPNLCIDSGNTSVIFSISATDLEGNPRLINKGINPTPPAPQPTREVDMGAFEVQ